MFGKKKQVTTIDKDQLELIENAQKRIRQKKRLYIHFVIFLIGAVFLILANTVLGIAKDFTIAGIDWFVYAILAWLFLFAYHFFNVFVTNKFMGKDWEKQQLDKLVNQQQHRIEKLKQNFLKEETKIAQTEAYNETLKQGEVSEKKKSNELTIIVAAGENNAIGKDNDLIWHLSNDLKRFKSLTNGHHIIMGRKTFESFPKPLPNRTHIVITRQSDYKAPDGVIIVNNLEDALDAARNDKQPFIIGGGEIYKQAMPIVDKLEITRVHASFKNADTFFPEIDDSKWQEVSRTTHDADEKHAYAFSFITYLRK
ncbi:dihydrofolate reductase [Winogradskyella echinorum]|uniref:dihydrofolate reductase n=1 Tax=Winogradskyella echinorum TaxID=538189 RepID=A0ABR6Y3U7_9FLAO|nr:dihydrofolate reductase [Winogradskyella echinorum]MBC3847419.1 dihydrofolate reductase [Winogradskyella echinorum]MBC5751767.1 dihydrofolate reductase [Winogradskyella echinorum]